MQNVACKCDIYLVTLVLVVYPAVLAGVAILGDILPRRRGGERFHYDAGQLRRSVRWCGDAVSGAPVVPVTSPRLKNGAVEDNRVMRCRTGAEPLVEAVSLEPAGGSGRGRGAPCFLASASICHQQRPCEKYWRDLHC